MLGAIRNKSHNDMMNILNQFAMQQLGLAPVGEIRMLSPGTTNAYKYMRDRLNEANMHTSIKIAYDATVTQRNDVILVTPDSQAWKGDTNAGGEVLTWGKENVHMLGMSPGELSGYQRARFSHSGYTMANFMTVSGNSNKFMNLRFMHGSSTGGASDVTCVTVNGAGNVFEWVNFGSPMDATQAGATAYAAVVVGGTQNYFRNCLFGTSNDVSRTAANCLLKFSTTAGGMNIFENCIFKSRAEATTAIMINDAVTATTANYTGVFLNCQFLNFAEGGYSTLAVGITKAANATRQLFFDARCTFSGITQLVTIGQEASIVWGGGGVSSDTTAIHDRKALGLASVPVAP